MSATGRRGGTVRVSAPGKLFWTGEYAVLAGAPARVVAMNRRVVVESADAGTWSVVSSLQPGQRVPFDPDGPPPPGGAALTAWRIVTAHRAAVAATLPPQALAIDSTALHHGALKLGLGSSAAVVVATTAALDARAGVPFDLARAVAVHDAAQGQRGSGADVAAGALGGCIRYCRDPAGGIAATAVGLPAVAHAWIWLGEPASTVSMVRQFDAWRQADPGRIAPLLAAARAAADLGGDAADAGHWVAAVAAMAAALQQMADAAGIGVMAGGHDRLLRLADGERVAYKPSGAGGGEFGLVVAVDDDDLQRFLDRAAPLGAPVPGLEMDRDGLRVDWL